MSKIDKKTLDKLCGSAVDVRRRAKALYSKFNVGAALLDKNGKIWTGCNIESSSYGLTVCAERVAIFKALSEGVDTFEHIVIAASGEGEISPCGACRQVLQDYAPGINISLYDPEKKTLSTKNLSDFYPYPFSDSNLAGKK